LCRWEPSSFRLAGPQIAVVNGHNQIELHKVALGRDFGNTIEITNGITASDRIVASPPDYLVNGCRSPSNQPLVARRVKGTPWEN